LFVHWTGDDIDLSALLLDAQFADVAHISFTKLREFRCIHSGDVRIAPNGASEFIDFEVSDLLNHEVRYVVASVISFSGGAFDAFPCYTGFMARDCLTSGRKFEPASVQIKFDVSAPFTSMLSVIFDLVERKVVYADIASGVNSFSTVVGGKNKLVAQTKAVLALAYTKPTAWDILHAHVTARGQLVDDIEGAELAYMASTVDLEAVLALTAVPPRDTRPSATEISPSLR
jgi:hypothetical protein